MKTARSVANHVRFGRCAEEPNVDRLSRTPAVTGSYDSAVIRDRFRLASAPTVLARTASVAPISFTRLTNESAGMLRTKDVPREAAYCLHVVLGRFSLDMWVDGKHVFGAPAQAGVCFLFDLSQNPVCEYRTAFDTMRFYISRASLDELSFDRGVRRAGRFKPCLGAPDRAMHGLATAVIDQVEQAGGRNTLFVDHIGLAFHAHLTDAYGDVDARGLSGIRRPFALATSSCARFSTCSSRWGSHDRRTRSGVRAVIGIFRPRVPSDDGRRAPSVADREAHRASARIAAGRATGSRGNRRCVRFCRSEPFHPGLRQARGVRPGTMAQIEPAEIATSARDRIASVSHKNRLVLTIKSLHASGGLSARSRLQSEAS